ncbi:MAG TPA: hypothetical protein VGC66_22695 [Pyrinomonadaceae bacterium]
MQTFNTPKPNNLQSRIHGGAPRLARFVRASLFRSRSCGKRTANP